ncbi:MAG TPA: ATP-binding protein [Anaerolineales bacterium]|nr:ATP-binding protein [Anaerolineales bacterium]
MRLSERLHLSWRGVTTQLFALVVLPLSVLTIAIAFGGLSLHRAAMRTMVGERDERAVRAAASALSEQLNHRTKAVRGLALLAGDAFTPASLRAALDGSDYLLEDFDLGLAYFERGGGLLASAGGSSFWEDLDPARPPLDAALRRDAPPSLLMLPHPADGEPVVVVLAAAGKGGPITAGAFDPAGLARGALAGIFPSEPGSLVILVDPSGILLYQSGSLSASETAETHPGVREALEGNSGTNYVPVPGGEHVVSYSPVSPAGWALVIEEPWETVTPPLLRMTQYAPLVLIPALLLALVALWFGVRQIVQPLQALESRAAELSRGRYEAVEEPVGGIAEIRRLQDELVRLAHRVRAAQAGLRSYIGAITTAQEEERRRLARELHDETLQALIALNQRIQLAALATVDPGTTTALEELRGLAGQTIDNLRRLTRGLRPIYLEDLGLAAALEVLAREISGLSGIPIRFGQSGEPRRLEPLVELALFRMAQEALNNVARHARAGRGELEIVYVPGAVILHVRDDGRGFDPPETAAELAPQGHFGLLGIHERAELIGARLEIRSEPGAGTQITIVLPKPD